MSNTAFRRDLEEPRTVDDFASLVQSMERLRLLLVLTVADIRAVGPNVWNGWKGQLLRELYYRAEEAISGGHGTAIAKHERVEEAVAALRERLSGWDAGDIEAHVERLVAPYWLAFDRDTHLRHAGMMRDAGGNAGLAVHTENDPLRTVTVVTVFAPDRRGLFARIAGAIAVAGASIVDARIFTTRDGMALDTFRVQNERAAAFDDERRLRRLRETVHKALLGALDLDAEIARRRAGWLRGPDLAVPPRVLIDNNVSTRHTLIEITAKDRSGLLSDLAGTLTELGLSIVTARVATFGERAVDAFYLRDAYGLKITHPTRLAAVRKRLIETIENGEAAALSGAA